MSPKRFQQQLRSEMQPAAIGGRSAPGQSIPPPPMPLPAIRLAPRPWLLAAAAVMLFILPLAILLARSFGNDSVGPTIPAPMNGVAQSGSLVPCSTATPTTSEIIGTPANETILSTNTWAELPDQPGYSVPAIDEQALPVGPAASQNDLKDIQQTLAAFATCLYQHEFERADDFYSDDSFRRSESNRGDSFQITVTPDPTLALLPTPTSPLDTYSAPVVPVIRRSNVLPDGRIGVLLDQDLGGRRLQQYIILVRSERGWLIDEEVYVTWQTPDSPEPSMLMFVITAIDLQFQPPRIEVPADSYVTLVVRNEGQARKTFVIPDLDVDVELLPGTETEILINPPKGVYEFYSDVPGQKAAGLSGWIVAIPGN